MNTSQHQEAVKAVPQMALLSNISKAIKPTLLSIALLMLFSIQTYGQDEAWTLLKDEGGVKVYYQIADCESQSEVADPLNFDPAEFGHQTFKLKLVNDNVESKSITFSKVTKTDDSDELETLSIGTGTTLLETCEASPKMILTKTEGDHYPVAVTDFLTDFQITIND